MLYKAREYGRGDEGVMGLYMALSMGEDVEAPLNPPGVARFVYDKHNRVSTNGKLFYRTVRSAAAQERVKSEREKIKEGKPGFSSSSAVLRLCRMRVRASDGRHAGAAQSHMCARSGRSVPREAARRGRFLSLSAFFKAVRIYFATPLVH